MITFKHLVPVSDRIIVSKGNHCFDDLLMVDLEDFQMSIFYRSEEETRVVGIDEEFIYLYKDGMVQKIGLTNQELEDEFKINIDLSNQDESISFYSCGTWIWIYQGDRLIERVRMGN